MVVVRPSLIGALAPGVDVDLPTTRGPLTREEAATSASDPSITRPRLLPAKNPFAAPAPVNGEIKSEPAEATEPELPLLP